MSLYEEPRGMMVGGIEDNPFPFPKPLIQKKQVFRRSGGLDAHGIAPTAWLSGCALAATKAAGRQILISEEQE
ncbi:MAG: hypothetical protein ABSA29_07085 [Terriglobales bacterium]